MHLCQNVPILTWTSPGLAAVLSACPREDEDFSAPVDPPLASTLKPSQSLPGSASSGNEIQ